LEFRDLPRVNLQDLLDGGYEPVIAHQGPDAFIVMAPPGGAADQVLDGLAGLARAPRTFVESPEEVGAIQAEQHGDFQLAATIRQRAGLSTRGRRSTTPQDVNFPEAPDAKLGLGQDTGEIRAHPRVDLAQGTGVGFIGGLGGELGTSVPSPFTSWVRREYNRDLFGIKGLRMYDKMRKSDGTVRGTLRLAKTPVLGGQWSMKPASDSDKDKMIADFVWQNLTRWMSTSWPQLLTEALLMLDFGYYMFEKVFAPGELVTNDPRARGKIVWKKLAPRHPMDVKEWFFDMEGGPLSVDMWAPPVMPGGFQGGVFQGYMQWTNIPINKLAVFSFDKEAGNIEGISLLRSAYKHWYYKDNLYKIDAIQKERHGIGVPVIQLPAGYNPTDLANADALGRNLRTNDRAHVVLPPNWTLSFAELSGQPVDCIKSIEHHDGEIEKQILGQFLSPKQKTAEQDQTLFLKATRFTADIVTDVLNSFAIPQLVDMNWAGVQYPMLTVKRIGEQEDWRTTSFSLRNYVGAGIIVPDDVLEAHLREEMGLPPADPTTSRLVNTKFNQQMGNPPPLELPGSPEEMIQALQDGSITMEQLQQFMNQQPAASGQQQGAQAGLPRQSAPGPVAPSTGRGDGSGTSGRRGQ
jgi:hypothetical protein